MKVSMLQRKTTEENDKQEEVRALEARKAAILAELKELETQLVVDEGEGPKPKAKVEDLSAEGVPKPKNRLKIAEELTPGEDADGMDETTSPKLKLDDSAAEGG